jgi:hypothetical protein
MEKRLRSVVGDVARSVVGDVARSVVGDFAQGDGAPEDLVQRATRLGFTLAHFETDTGQSVWEWRQGDGPRPQFATERVARQWMSEWIERTAGDRPDTLAARRAQPAVRTLPAVVPPITAESA